MLYRVMQVKMKLQWRLRKTKVPGTWTAYQGMLKAVYVKPCELPSAQLQG
jgi:hypothetical protein